VIFVSSVVLSMSIKSSEEITAGNKQRKVSFEELDFTISLIVIDPLKIVNRKFLLFVSIAECRFGAYREVQKTRQGSRAKAFPWHA
jgi:hypothetical protein